MWFNINKLGYIGLMIISLVSLTGFMPAQENDPAGEEPYVRITQVDTSQFPQVTVYISAIDVNGEPVGVAASQLVLDENGVEITPDFVSGVGEVGPLNTLLVIDISGSMNSLGKLAAAKDAAKAYVNQSRPNDATGLLTFNTQYEYVQPLTTDNQVMVAAIDGLRAYDDTAMYDALIRGVEILGPVSGRKAIIVLTDGMDNRSKSTPEDVITGISTGGLSISTIGLGDPRHSEGNLRGLDEAALMELAENAGGVYGYADDAEGLKNLYERYGRALQSEYVLTYTSPSTLRDGVNRSLTVSLSNESSAATTEIESTTYNPGGLVPEVGQPASWVLFFTILAGLLLLLVLPAFLGKAILLLRGHQKGKVKFPEQQSRIKLKN
ncbi:MAG: VWA domain-containing protein [Anaerolineales bacterium]|nr:VWA domain-containing protein [Anaerolineales bacterium]